jgi:glycosyltransferase involved in cell wall biosynthesis
MVCASNMDGTPGPALEGAACSTALLSTPIGNMPSFIVNGVNGYLTDATLPYVWPGVDVTPDIAQQVADGRAALQKELAQRMREMAANPERTRAMGLAARQTVLDGWTWEHQVKLVAPMWSEVLNA